jgi:hypothetical protein
VIAGLIFGAYFVAIAATILWPRFARWRTDYIVRPVYPKVEILQVVNTIDRLAFYGYGKDVEDYVFQTAERQAIQSLMDELQKSGYVRREKTEDNWEIKVKYSLMVTKEKTRSF